MGLLRKIFGSKPKQANKTDKTSSELLKEATQMRKAGDWDGAIGALKQAYKNAKSEGVSYGADTYLRLPKYLYEAGMRDEAWQEYNRALTHGLDGELPAKEMADVNHGQIYGSMAGQLKKEKKFYDAAVYQAVAALSWEKGMLAQKRKSAMDFDSIKKTLNQSLKKHGDNEIEERFISLVKDALTNPKKHKATDLIRKLNDLK
tara:strand:+ start:2853 stop:3461 length:609 start_codon:yes stop_codon:yes gene_type:complete